METAGSQGSFKARIRLMKEPAFDHPSVRPVIEEWKKRRALYRS